MNQAAIQRLAQLAKQTEGNKNLPILKVVMPQGWPALRGEALQRNQGEINTQERASQKSASYGSSLFEI